MKDVQKKIREFSEERDWDQFHSPKNLVMALSSEVGELEALFRWLSEKQSYEVMNTDRDNVLDEMGDVYILLLQLADKLEIDLNSAALKKLEKNKIKYPKHLSKGVIKKYSELEV